MMLGNEYQRLAARTMNTNLNKLEQIQNASMGMCGESGEVADVLKKYLFQGHELDTEKLKDETGDVLWYVACMCTALDISMDELMNYNLTKLSKRYIDGKFNANHSVNRNEQLEMGLD